MEMSYASVSTEGGVKMEIKNPLKGILFKTFLVHGHISHPVLCCALLPIVKSSKKSKFSADNYRLIAISSLILNHFHYMPFLQGTNISLA